MNTLLADFYRSQFGNSQSAAEYLVRRAACLERAGFMIPAARYRATASILYLWGAA